MLVSDRDSTHICKSACRGLISLLSLAWFKTAARVNREQLAQAITQAIAYFQGLPAWQCPQASYTAFVQLPFPAEAFCRHLALERRILLLPASVFGPAYENFIRDGLGGDTHQFQEGMSIMLDELLRWRERSHMRG